MHHNTTLKRPNLKAFIASLEVGFSKDGDVVSSPCCFCCRFLLQLAHTSDLKHWIAAINFQNSAQVSLEDNGFWMGFEMIFSSWCFSLSHISLVRQSSVSYTFRFGKFGHRRSFLSRLPYSTDSSSFCICICQLSTNIVSRRSVKMTFCTFSAFVG